MEFYTIDGVKVAVAVYGKGMPVVVLHGWGSSSASWRSFAKDLSQQGCRVVIPDLPGFGKSPEPPKKWGLPEYAEMVNELLKALDIQHAVFVGHSFGGRVAIEYSSRWQDSMDAIVLCGAAGIYRHGQRKAQMFRVLSRYGNTVLSLPGFSLMKEHSRKAVYAILGTKDYYVASETMRAVMSRVIDKPLRKYLKDIKIPALLLWGEKDSVTPLKDANIAHDLIPDSKLLICKGGGHSLQRDNPKFLSSNISIFLNEKSLQV